MVITISQPAFAFVLLIPAISINIFAILYLNLFFQWFLAVLMYLWNLIIFSFSLIFLLLYFFLLAIILFLISFPLMCRNSLFLFWLNFLKRKMELTTWFHSDTSILWFSRLYIFVIYLLSVFKFSKSNKFQTFIRVCFIIEYFAFSQKHYLSFCYFW